MLAPDAEITACDVNTAKLDLLRRSAVQLGLANIRAVKRDATQAAAPAYDSAYDKIICDVPCSGLGVIGRKPEILLNITKTHIDNLLGLQHTILSRAADQLKDGGALVYSTCTINPDENIRQIERLLSERNDMSLSAINLGFELTGAHEEMRRGYLQLWPDKDACDGFFIAKLTRNRR
jgi:16S rRNA (cytosine967-C5)-methyltransferase